MSGNKLKITFIMIITYQNDNLALIKWIVDSRRQIGDGGKWYVGNLCS